MTFPVESKSTHQSGIVLLTVMVFIFVTTLAAGTMVQSYQSQRQRENEEELLFVGAQYRKAIAAYYNTVPLGRARTLPTSLDSLLEDVRSPTPRQHLRRLYPDPMTGKADWDLIVVNGGVVGVRSKSMKEPFKKTGFFKEERSFEGATSYSQWVFQIETNR